MPDGAKPALSKPLLRGWSHLLALVIFIPFGVWLIIVNPGDRYAVILYVVSVCSMFGASAALHIPTWPPGKRKVFRKIDHSMIFFVIAGTYTVIGTSTVVGIPLVVTLVVVWGGSALGVGMKWFWIDAPKWLSAAIYVAVGWVAVVMFPQLLHALGVLGLTLLFLGGLSFTVGAVFYATKWPKLNPRVFGYHELFHLFVIVGVGIQFVVVAFFAL